MTRPKILSPTEITSLLFASGWDVQANGRVLCPVRGVTPQVSVNRSKVLLLLRSGTQSILEAGRPLRVQRPPAVCVDGVTLVSFERADLRDAEVLERAAALVRSVGARRGVLTGQSEYRDQVMVRVDGLT